MPLTTSRKPLATALALVLGAAVLGGCLQTPSHATDLAPAVSPASQVLPDFARIVADNGAAVVNVTVKGTAKDEGPDIPEELIPFFRQFPFPLPQQPREIAGLGSGFVISPDGYVLTNHHVVDGADDITVHLADKRAYRARVVGSDKLADIALLKIDATGLPTVKIGDPTQLRVGEWVLAIGAPFGLERTATQGIVSALGRSLPSDNYVPFIQTDVPINPGNSGGPLFDAQGRVVGINSQIYSRTGGYMGLSFAIPIDVAMKVADQLKAGGKVERGWLGVVMQELTPELAKSFRMEAPRGALVAGVTAKGPASEAGLKPGDVIVADDGKPIADSGQLPPLVGATRPGSRVPLTVMREGQQRVLEVEIGQLPGDEAMVKVGAEAPREGRQLNIAVAPLNPQTSSRLGVDSGVVVRQVGPGPAHDAGVRPGDVLLALDGKPVANPTELRERVQQLQPGHAVPLLVQRDGGTLFLALTLPEAKPAG